MSTVDFRRLLIVLMVTVSCREEGFARERQTGLIKMECLGPSMASAGELLELRCQIVNGGLGSQSVYVLGDRLALEGPTGEGSPYVYVPSGWERFENVLRYDRRAVKELDPPSPFHPTVHLTLEKINRLIPLRGGGSMNVDVRWKLPGKMAYPNKGEWLLRVKIVYLTQERLSRLLRDKDISKTCRDSLGKAISSIRPRNKITLEASRHKNEASWYYDGCRDVISEEFQHLYSNIVVLPIKD